MKDEYFKGENIDFLILQAHNTFKKA